MTALHARWRPEHQNQPVTVRAIPDIDDLLNTLLAEPSEHPIAADLSLDPSIPPGRSPDRLCPQLLIGVNAREQLGSARLTLHGHWYAQGNAGPDPTECAYHLLGARRAFPADALVSLHEVAVAVEDFLVNNGRRRPPCLAWTAWPGDPDPGLS